MKNVLLLLLLILSLGSLQGCRESSEAEALAKPDVLIRVDGREVTLDRFRQEFAQSLPPDQELSALERDELRRSFLGRYIDRELVLAEADRLQLNVSAEELEAALQDYRRDYPSQAFEEMLQSRRLTLDQWRRELEEGLLMEKVVRRGAFARVLVEEQEIAAYFEEHREAFDRPEQVRARQLVVATEEEGQRILGLLRQGEPFGEMARLHSLSPDGEQGGDLGFFSRGEMPPEFDEVVFSLPVGRLSDLVKSEYGFHLFLVEERRPARKLGLEDVREEIRRLLLERKEEAAYQAWLQDLRSRARIDVDWSLLDPPRT